jgi:hypothetical protein
VAYYIAVQQRPRGRFSESRISRSNIVINLHFHQPTSLSEKAGEILTVILVVLSGALALVTIAAS